MEKGGGGNCFLIMAEMSDVECRCILVCVCVGEYRKGSEDLGEDSSIMGLLPSSQTAP